MQARQGLAFALFFAIEQVWLDLWFTVGCVMMLSSTPFVRDSDIPKDCVQNPPGSSREWAFWQDETINVIKHDMLMLFSKSPENSL